MRCKTFLLALVAAVCGAATPIAAPPARPETTEILVAAKALAPGTHFTPASIPHHTAWKTVRTAPPNAVTRERDLSGMMLLKSLKPNEFIRASDAVAWSPTKLPPGMNAVTIDLVGDSVLPRIKPGTRVDIVGKILNRRQNRMAGMTVLPNALVWNVNDPPPVTSASQYTCMMLTRYTLDLNRDGARLIRLAEKANVELSFVLLGEEPAADANAGWSADAVTKWIDDVCREKSLPASTANSRTCPP